MHGRHQKSQLANLHQMLFDATSLVYEEANEVRLASLPKHLSGKEEELKAVLSEQRNEVIATHAMHFCNSAEVGSALLPPGKAAVIASDTRLKTAPRYRF